MLLYLFIIIANLIILFIILYNINKKYWHVSNNTIELLKLILLSLILVKIIFINLATIGLIGAGVGIGVVFGALIFSVVINFSLRGQSFSYAIFDFYFIKATWLFVFMLTFLFSTPDLCFDCHSLNFIADDELDPYNDEDKEWEI